MATSGPPVPGGTGGHPAPDTGGPLVPDTGDPPVPDTGAMTGGTGGRPAPGDTGAGPETGDTEHTKHQAQENFKCQRFLSYLLTIRKLIECFC